MQVVNMKASGRWNCRDVSGERYDGSFTVDMTFTDHGDGGWNLEQLWDSFLFTVQEDTPPPGVAGKVPWEMGRRLHY